MTNNSSSNPTESFRRDGVVVLRNALAPSDLKHALGCYEWSLDHPTESACRFYESNDTMFYQDLCHPRAALAYRDLLEHSDIADTVAYLWDTPEWR